MSVQVEAKCAKRPKMLSHPFIYNPLKETSYYTIGGHSAGSLESSKGHPMAIFKRSNKQLRCSLLWCLSATSGQIWWPPKLYGISTEKNKAGAHPPMLPRDTKGEIQWVSRSSL